MAQRNVVVMIDDLTGKKISAGTGETVLFSLDGVSYELDVNSKGARQLRAELAPYVDAGRRISGGRAQRQTRRVKTAADPTAIRAWAASNGISVSNRGRISADVVAQYEAAGN